MAKKAGPRRIKTSPKPPKNKRRDLFSYTAWDALCDRLCAQLLPPRPAGTSSIRETLSRLAAGKPDQQEQWDRRREELFWEIEECWSDADDYVETPWQIEAMREDLKKQGWEDPSEDEAISCLFSSTWALERDTLDYLAKEWPKRVRLPKPSNPERKQRAFAESIRKLKRLLKDKGIKSQQKADDMIAAGLGLPSAGALWKRLGRAPRK